MSQLSVQNPSVGQAGFVPTQATSVSSVRDTPAALSARLSGSGADKPAFDPARMHRDRCLPHMADKLADRPLGDSEGAKAAGEARDLFESLQGKPVTKEDLGKLEELRAGAWKNDETGKAGTYCDTLARVLLLRPLMSKLDGIKSDEARARLAKVLHAQMDRLLSVKEPQEFEQIRSELRATRELFKQEGILDSEQQGALDQLDAMLACRRNYAKSLDTLQEKAEQAKTGEKSAPRLGDVLDEVETLRDAPDSSAPPLGEMALRSLRPEAGNLAATLYNFSKDEAGKLSGKINKFLEEIRNPGTNPDDVNDRITALRTELEKKTGVLTEHDRGEITKKMGWLAGAVEVRERVARAESALEQKDKASELEDLRAELREGRNDLVLHEDDVKRLDTALDKLGSKSAALRTEARLGESNFAGSIENQIKSAGTDQEKYSRLARQIDERLEKLENPSYSPNLSSADRATAGDRLRELAQQCLVSEFMEALKATQSTRLNAPSVAQCAERVDEIAERRGIKPEAIRKQLAEISGKVSEELEARLNDLQAGIPKMTVEELRGLPLTDIAKAMERRLLPEDGAALEPKLKTLISGAEEAILEKTVGPELEGEGAFARLDASQKATLRELCMRGGCHPSLISALKNAAGVDAADAAPHLTAAVAEGVGKVQNAVTAVTGNRPLPPTSRPVGLNTMLEAAERVFAAPKNNKVPDPKDVEQVDAFLLPHPELDDAAWDILGNGEAPDYRFDSARNSRDLGIQMDRFFPKELKREYGLNENTPVGIDTLKKLVQDAADAGGGTGRALKKLDLTLIQALWSARKAETPDLTFEAFKQGLPEPFDTMPMLKEHLASGIRGRRELKKLEESVEGVSHGLGSKKALVRFLAQAQADDPKWAAGAASAGLYRSLGLNAHQDLRDVFRNTVKDAEKTTANRKKEDAGKALGAAHDLRVAGARVEEADRAIKLDPVRCEMANRLGIDLTKTSTPDVDGATLATGILMAEEILRDPNTSREQKQKLLNCIHFQGKCCLDGKTMKGESNPAIGKHKYQGDTQGLKFRSALGRLRINELTTEEDRKSFDQDSETMLGMCADVPPDGKKTENDPELTKRAEAVLFFKSFSSKEPEKQIGREFKQIENGKKGDMKELDSVEKAAYDSYKKNVKNRMRTVIGTGQRQNEALAVDRNQQRILYQDAQNILKDAQKAYTKEERKTLSNIADLVICEQFIQSDLVTAADVGAEFESCKTNPESSPFYRACLGRMVEMGIPAEHAGVYLERKLEGMKDDFFARLAQKGLQGADTHTELDRLVTAWMGELEEPGNSLTFKKSDGVSINVPVVEAGAAEISAHLEVARENGISVWKGDDGTYHMTLMKGAKVGLGVGAEVGLDSFISAVEAEAGVNVQGSKGCDLEFPNQARCRMFLSALLSGRAGADHLGLCGKVRSVTEKGVGASAELTLGASVLVDEDTDILSVGITGSAEIFGIWKTTSTSNQVQRTRTVYGAVSVSAQLSIGTEEMRNTVAAIGEDLDTAAYVAEEAAGRGDIAEALQDTGQAVNDGLSLEKKLYRREFEEERTVAARRDGTLESSERVRAFVLNSKSEAVALLRNAGASEQSIRDVLEDLNRLPLGTEFRIEMVSEMRQDAVNAYNAVRAGGGKPEIRGQDFELNKLRLVTEDSYERTTTFNARVLKIHSGRSLTRTHAMEYNPRPVPARAA